MVLARRGEVVLFEIACCWLPFNFSLADTSFGSFCEN